MKEHYQDSHVSFSVELLEGEILTSIFEGSGSNKGTDQYLAWIEEAISIVGLGKLKVLMDLRNQKSTDENKCVDNLSLQFFSKKQLSYYRLYLMSIDK